MTAHPLIVRMLAVGICLVAVVMTSANAAACPGHRAAQQSTLTFVERAESQVTSGETGPDRQCPLPSCCGARCNSAGHVVPANAPAFELDRAPAIMLPREAAARSGLPPPGIRRPPRG